MMIIKNRKELREKKIGIWKDIKANYPSNNKSQQNTKQQSNTQKTTQANNTKAVTKTDNASNTNTAQGKIKGNKKLKYITFRVELIITKYLMKTQYISIRKKTQKKQAIELQKDK